MGAGESFMATMVQLTCPGCKQEAYFSPEQLAVGVACPACGRPLRPSVRSHRDPPTSIPTQRAALAKIPALIPEDPPTSPGKPPAYPEESPRARLERQRKQRFYIGLGITGFLVVLVGGMSVIFLPKLIESLNASHA